jgi:putative hydrolase of the HAD superfamily
MHDERRTHALLIDGLGTLVALAPPAPALAAELAGRFGLAVEVDNVQRALAAEIAFYRAHMGEGRDRDSLAALRARCAEVLRRALAPSAGLAAVPGPALTDALLDALRFSAFPDARGALIAARRRGARVIVVSNWDVSLIDVLERVGLAPLIDAVVTSAAVGARKPDTAIFAHALGLAGVAPERALHVGDSPSEDVAGARACGIPALLLCRDGAPAPQGMTAIASLGEIAWP